MNEIRLLSEKTLEIDFRTHSFGDEELMESLGRDLSHPRFRLIKIIEKEYPQVKSGRDKIVSDDILWDKKLHKIVCENEFLDYLDQFIASKNLPFIIDREVKPPRICKAVVENNILTKITLKIIVNKTDEDFIVPSKFDIIENIFDVLNHKEMTLENVDLYFDKDLHLKGRFNFFMENEENLLTLLPKIEENKHVKDYFVEKFYLEKGVAGVDMNVYLNEFKEDISDE